MRSNHTRSTQRQWILGTCTAAVALDLGQDLGLRQVWAYVTGMAVQPLNRRSEHPHCLNHADAHHHQERGLNEFRNHGMPIHPWSRSQVALTDLSARQSIGESQRIQSEGSDRAKYLSIALPRALP